MDLKPHPRFFPIYRESMERAYMEDGLNGPGAVVRKSWELHDTITADAEVACREGCAFCCSKPIRSTPAEADIAAEYAVKANSPAMLDQLSKALSATKRLIKDATAVPRGFERAYAISGRVCPFLTMHKTCSIYPVRPLACRTRHSLDERLCKAAKQSGMDGHPVPEDYGQKPMMAAQLKALEQARVDVFDEVVGDKRGRRTQRGEHWKWEYFVPMVLNAIDRYRVIYKKGSPK